MNKGLLNLLLDSLRQACLDAYGDRLVSLAVFGSWARGVATPESDLDILIVADPLPRGRLKRLDEFDAVERATESSRADVWPGAGRSLEISPVFKTPAELKAGSPLYLDMTHWRVVLHDRGDVLANYLSALAARMAELGSRRIESHGGGYWDYKPSFAPGEVVEL
jgi:predicted nucleotidyltransferase